MAYKGKRINPEKFERGQLKIILIVLPLVIFMALPLIFIINHAFKPMEELFAFPPRFFVRNPTLENFTKLIKFSRTSGTPLSRYVFNSIIVTVLTVGLSLLLTTCAAFAFSKIRFKGRSLMLQINQIAIMFVATAVLIPGYMVISKMGLIDNILAHVLPLVAMPVALFLVKQFVDQVPDSLIEAAYMDGATDFQVYWKVIIPMIKPAIATAMVLVFQQVWTNMETSSYFINDESMKTMTFYMNTLVNANNTVAGQGVGVGSLADHVSSPNLILFFICQSKVMNTMATFGHQVKEDDTFEENNDWSASSAGLSWCACCSPGSRRPDALQDLYGERLWRDAGDTDGLHRPLRRSSIGDRLTHLQNDVCCDGDGTICAAGSWRDFMAETGARPRGTSTRRASSWT